MRKSGYYLAVRWLIPLAFFLSETNVEAQRLSQGASDWYMRFHSYDFVKRNVERIVTKSFTVTSLVEHRYAITEVRTVVHNPATVKQEFNFGFVMPRTAFVSKVHVARINPNGSLDDVVTSRFKESEWMQKKFPQGDDGDEDDVIAEPTKRGAPPSSTSSTSTTASTTTTAKAHANGGSNGHGHDMDDDLTWDLIHGDRVNFKQFILKLSLKGMDEVALTLVYEYTLERTNNKYHHNIATYPGELVKDFQIRFMVVENRNITGLKLKLPVIGEIYSADFIEGKDNAVRIVYNMTEIQQFDSFGNHGFAGDVSLEYDVEVEGGTEIVAKDGFFAHFYHGPTTISQMRGIPMHILILFDIGESMSGPKMIHAKGVAQNLLSMLDDGFFLNFITFNEVINEWRPDDVSPEADAFPCTKENLASALTFLEEIQPHSKNVSDLSGAVLRAIELDKKVWSSGIMPDNALTTIVLITDGHATAGDHQTQKEIVHIIKQANRAEQIPIFAMGIGFDANMDLLKDITDRSPGGVSEHINEDINVEPQMRSIRLHLKDVVLKNVNFNYVGKEFRKNSLTKNRFKFFHSGGAVVVAGKYDPAFPPRVTISGAAADGNYEVIPTATIFEAEKACQGTATLCSEPRFRGECITVDDSKPSLKDRAFSNRAVSIKVTGDCAWIVCDLNNYRGFNLTLLPGSYEGIPDMHRTISSLKKVPLRQLVVRNHLTVADQEGGGDSTTNTVARLWAFQTVQNALEKEENNAWTNGQGKRRHTLARAFQVAVKFGFLTPLTDMYLEPENPEEETENVEPKDDVIVTNIFSYRDLNPIFFQKSDPDIERQWTALKSCIPPVHCQDNFHYEIYQEDAPTRYELENEKINGKVNCSGSITIYTKPKMKGDSLTIDESLHQIYNSKVSQRMQSLVSEGDCCWLLFDHRFFAGNVEKICGNVSQEIREKPNIGSMKKIMNDKKVNPHIEPIPLD